jgi:hypothetical protein
LGDETVRIDVSGVLSSPEKPLVVAIKIGNQKNVENCSGMIDTGALGGSEGFIDPSYAQHLSTKYNLPILSLQRPIPTRDFAGREGPFIQHYICPTVVMGNHYHSSQPLYITPLGQHYVIFSKKWTHEHGAILDMGYDQMTFRANFCTHVGAPTKMRTIPFLYPHLEKIPESRLNEAPPVLLYPSVSRSTGRSERKDQQQRLERMNQAIKGPTARESTTDPQVVTRAQNLARKAEFERREELSRKLNAVHLGAETFLKVARREGVQVCSVTIQEVEEAIEEKKEE